MSFLDIALRNAARGFRVFPVHRGDKKPLIVRFPEWAATDTKQIEEWARKFPDANCGVMSDDVHLIVDTDRWDRLQELFAEQLQRDPALFDTYAVSARANRRQLVFLQTDKSRAMRKRNLDFALPGEPDNVFEFKSHRKFGMGEGSLHKTGSTYAIVQDRPLKPVPDILIDRAEELAASVIKPSSERVHAKIPEGGRRNALVEEAGRMRGAVAVSETVLLAHLQEFNEQWCDPPMSDEDVKHVAANCNWETPPPEPKLVIGNIPATEDLKLAEKSAHPSYPDDAWHATIFGAFADIVCRGNDIPYKFAAETFRIITGALVGDTVSCGVAGVRMRDYGALIGPPQGGKSYGLERTEQFYSEIEQALLWHYDSDYRPRGIGAQKFLPGSSNSFVDQLNREEEARMAALTRKAKKKAEAAIEIEIDDTPPQWKPCVRYITIQGEAMSLLARFGNDWTGKSLSTALTDLYDGGSAEVPITSNRGAPKIKVKLQYSMLLCTQPHIWRKCVAESLVDSGLFGRFYIVGSERAVRQEQLPDYAFPQIFELDFGALRREVFARITYLADHPLLMTVSEDAKRRLNEWDKEQAALSPLDHIDRSRLGLHVWRAAMARAWGALPQRTEITLEDADGAIRLGEYQVKMRQYYAPPGGDDRDATAINTVRQAIRVSGRLSLYELKRRVHADRMGRRFNTSMEYLQRQGEITLLPRMPKGQTVAWVTQPEEPAPDRLQ
jgi:hypothetical protein